MKTKDTAYSLIRPIVYLLEDLQMKAQVDQSLCIGCALCVSMCDTVFAMNDDGVSESIINEIPENLLEDALEAKDCCPVDAIVIE